MTIDKKSSGNKLQYLISRSAPKISGLSSGRVGKYDCLIGEEVLPPQKHKKIKLFTKCFYSSLKNAF